MRRLLVGDRKVRVRDEGEAPISTKKAPLVLIHGAGASSVIWMDVVRRLSGRRRVIAPDLPGHGQSDPWHAPSIDLYRDAVGTICAKLGVERVVLVGHSMGGAVALRCAQAWPERVAALVLVCTGARLRVSPALLKTLADPQADAAALLAEVGYSPSTPREIVERWRAVLVQAPREILVADLAACDGFDLRPELPKLRMPALVVGGSDDLFTPPKLSTELAAGLHNARAVVIPHAGHFVHHERPDAFHAAADPFLIEVP